MSSGIVKNVSTDRIILKNYYRKTTGFMSIMNSIFLLALAMIAFYISEYFTEIANITDDVEGGVAGLLSIVSFGSLAALFPTLGFGIAGLKREKDENFNNQRVTAVLGAVLEILYILSTVVAFNDEANNIDNVENITYFMIGVGVAIAAIIYDVVIIMMTTKARSYCDRQKGKVAEVNFEVSEETLSKKTSAVVLSGFAYGLLSVWMLCFAFSGIISDYSANLAVDYNLDANIYMILAVIGLISVAGVVVCMVLNIKEHKKASIVTKICTLVCVGLCMIAIIFSVLTIGKEYAMPMVDGKLSYLFQYYIFMYVLVALSAALGTVSFKRQS